MRTGVKANDMEVVAIFLGESDMKLRHSPARIREALRSLDWGILDSKDFLDPSKTKGSVITRQTGSRKRAVNIYLTKLPQELQNAIKQGFHMHTITCHSVYQLSFC